MAWKRGASPFDVLANFFFRPKPAPTPEQDLRPVAEVEADPAPPLPVVAAASIPRKPPQPVPARPPFKNRGSRARSKAKAPAAAPQPFRPIQTGRLTPKLDLGPKPTSAPRPTGPEYLTGQDAIKYVLDRVDLTALNHSSPPVAAVSAATFETVSQLVRVGASILRATPKPDPMGFRVGLDFGTSTTKVVLCSDAADVDYAMPTPPELQVDEDGRRQDHLWRTCVWFNDETQCFQLIPCQASRAVLGFKTGLIQNVGHRMLASGISHNTAATAYLALLIAYTLGHDATRQRQAGAPGRHFSRFHIGVPLPSLEEDHRVQGFHRVVQAAFRLAPKADRLCLADVLGELQQPLEPIETVADSPYQLFEELAGVVAGYMLTPEKAGGPHIIVDVGAATLDVATFFIPDGEHPLEVYEADVGLFGAQALQCAIAADVPEATFKSACQAHTKGVLSRTFLTKNYSFLPGENNPSKPMIYVGGGRMTPLHKATYEGYSKAFLAPMRSPGVGRWLARDLATDQERLLLAWGLAQDPGTGAIPRIKPPSQVVPSLRGRRDWEGGYAGSEVC